MSIHFDDKFRLIRDFAEQVMPAFRGSATERSPLP
jgi:hypothetical protein